MNTVFNQGKEYGEGLVRVLPLLDVLGIMAKHENQPNEFWQGARFAVNNHMEGAFA